MHVKCLYWYDTVILENNQSVMRLFIIFGRSNIHINSAMMSMRLFSFALSGIP